jgi:hypothetical protein
VRSAVRAPANDPKDEEADAHQHRYERNPVEDQQLAGKSKYSAHG